MASIGILYTAAICSGGDIGTVGNVSEEWNGSNWTEISDLNTGREQLAGAGTNTAGVVAGGRTPGGTVRSEAETWNGSSWTEVGDLNTGRRVLGGAGHTNTNAIVAGGVDGPAAVRGYTESWNGSSWTEVNDLNTAGYSFPMAGSGTNALAIGRTSPSLTGKTEDWNGNNWTEVNDLNEARQAGGASLGGSNASALMFGGTNATVNVASTEEWSGSSVTTKVLTD